jgi:hypothetical protein
VRLRSDIWVAAYLRRRNAESSVAVLRRRGAAEAGAIFVKIDRLDGRVALYGPAPQSLAAELPRGVDRLFQRTHEPEWIDPADAEARLAREVRFDPDLWIVEVEDRDGEPQIDLAHG